MMYKLNSKFKFISDRSSTVKVEAKLTNTVHLLDFCVTDNYKVFFTFSL